MAAKHPQTPPDLSSEIKPLIHKLADVIGAKHGSIVTFIAARPGEGTTTVTRAFTKALSAETGKKILLIEAGGVKEDADDDTRYPDSSSRPSLAYDSRKPLLIANATHEKKQGVGIVEYAASGADIMSSLTHLGGGVYVGDWTTTPQGQSMSGRVMLGKDYWQALQSSFDVIVVDAPSLHDSSEGIGFAQISDLTILVVKADSTRREVIENLRDTLSAANAKIAGVVMNSRKYFIPQRLYKRL